VIRRDDVANNQYVQFHDKKLPNNKSFNYVWQFWNAKTIRTTFMKGVREYTLKNPNYRSVSRPGDVIEVCFLICN